MSDSRVIAVTSNEDFQEQKTAAGDRLIVIDFHALW